MSKGLTAMAEWLLDTSILIDILRGYKPAQVWVDSIPSAERYLSVITAAELLGGCRSRAEQRTVERELTLYMTLWLSAEVSQAAWEFYRRFQISHKVWLSRLLD
ncbi:MAG: PIN domain-containing protein [Chloroflexi bacterium]|nr:PIN domain-containing protein [Chloroflexota bacterium]